MTEKQFFIDRAEKKVEELEKKLFKLKIDRDGSAEQAQSLRDVLINSRSKALALDKELAETIKAIQASE